MKNVLKTIWVGFLFVMFSCSNGAIDENDVYPDTFTDGNLKSEAVTGTTKGSASIIVKGIRVENSVIKELPLYQVGVYLGDWHAGNNLGYTDQNGALNFTLDSGNHVLSFFKMTSSHSAFQSYNNPLVIEPNKTIYKTFKIAIDQVYLVVNYDCGFGNALYITGETDFLGNWKTAYKLYYNDYLKRWEFNGNLPEGAQYKIVKAKWVDGQSISTVGVQWEKGYNRTLKYASGQYQIYQEFTPVF